MKPYEKSLMSTSSGPSVVAFLAACEPKMARRLLLAGAIGLADGDGDEAREEGLDPNSLVLALAVELDGDGERDLV